MNQVEIDNLIADNKALVTAIADLLDCTKLNMDDMEPETLEAIQRAAALLAPQS